MESEGSKIIQNPAASVMHDVQPPHIGIAYVALLDPGDAQLSHEIIEARWFALDKLPAPLSPHTQQAIHAAVQVQRQ